MDFLLEIGTEEMPARAVDLGIDELKSNAEVLFKDSRLSFSEIKTFGTPRRLVLYVKELAARQEDVLKEVKGPAKRAAFDDAGKPTAAAAGFAKSQQVKVDSLEVRDIGGEYVFAVKRLAGQSTDKVLAALLPELIYSLQFPKSMRWGKGELRFIRPIRWLLSVYGDKQVRFAIEGLKSSNRTFGHRFLAPNHFEVKEVKDYFHLLEQNKVIVDQDRRRRTITAQIEKAAAAAGGRADMDLSVLGEVVNLVEYPHALAGSFDDEFLTIPKAVVKTAMESHQRYFPVEKDGKLLPVFIVVQNGPNRFSAHITRGHERVLRARLADAAFFFMEDTRRPLSEKAEQLKGVVYQKKLGSIYDKGQRVSRLCQWAAAEVKLSLIDTKSLLRAAYLCKADLVTGMVGEFPELQGIIGKEYAKVDREPDTVAAAIAEHYLPRYAGDELPETTVGALLSVADKVDSVVGCFSIGLIPSGSQDPYALRRQAQGTVAILAKANLGLGISELVKESLEIYKAAGIEADAKNLKELDDFWRVRLTKHFLNEGFSADQIEAVLAAGYTKLDEIGIRLQALKRNSSTSALEDAKIAFTRCINLAQPDLGMDVKESLLKIDEELALWKGAVKINKQSERLARTGDFDELVKTLAALRGPIDRFFDAVLVMDPDINLRGNRLRLLNICVHLAFLLADLSKLS